MKGKLYKSVKSREEIESSQLFSTMLQKVGNTGAVVIDGKNLMADSIYARHIQSKQITTDHLVVGVATADLINTGGLEITNELKVVHGGKDVLFINTDGALEMNISALKIGLVDFDKDINTKIEAIAGSWSQLNLNNAGDIISGINANDKGTNIHGKNITLTGDTDVQGDFKVSGNQVVLNANTDIRGDFKVSGGSVILDANTDVKGDFKVDGNAIIDGTLSANKIRTGVISAASGTSTLNMDTGDMVMGGNFNLGNGALEWDKVTKTLDIRVNKLTIGQYPAASTKDIKDVDEKYKGQSLQDKGYIEGTEIFTDKADNSVVHVEIDGKSYQGGEPTPDHPIEIHSLNDFDVVSSVGKRNLISDSGKEASGTEYSLTTYNWFNVEDVVGGERYTVTLVGDLQEQHSGWYLNTITVTNSGATHYPAMMTLTDSHKISDDTWVGTFTMPNATEYRGQSILYSQPFSNGVTAKVRGLSIVKGEYKGGYYPAPEDITEDTNHPFIDKINLSLSEPLRSVGDIKDRLFRDIDGLWKIERNMGEHTTDGTDIWYRGASSGGWNVSGSTSAFYSDTLLNKMKPSRNINSITNRFPVGNSTYSNVEGDNEEFTLGYASWGVIFRIEKSKLTTDDAAGFTGWIASNPVTIIYQLATPFTEILDQELQDKLNNLRSFQESNYVYTVINDKTDILPENLKPQIHTTFKGGGWYSRWKTEDELANRATKKELENIELTPGPPGPKGDKGDKGVDGRSISNVVIEYAASLSRTQVPPQSEFSPNTPIWSSGKYIWSQTRTTYEDNKPDSVSKPAVITGDEGQSVLDITQEYAVTTSKTIVPSSYQFSTTRAAWEIGRYVWTRSKITYENPTKVDYTTPVVSTEWEAVNDIDAKINNAVTTIDGTGVTVKDGNFFLEDDSSSEKYSLKIKTNLITDHGIEFVSPTTAATNISGGATFNMAKEVYSGSHNNVYSHMPTGNIDIWSIGSPYLYISYLPNDFVNADYTPIFGATSGVVNNQNYFEAKVDSRISKNTTYTFSAHFKKHPNMTGSYPKIEVLQRRKQSTSEYVLASETFSYTSSNEDVIRYSVTFTTNNEFSTGMYFLRLRVTSSNSNYVMVDGLQLVEGNHPVQYHSEDTASFYQRDNRTQISGLQFDVRQLQSNKPIHSQGTGPQGKWIRFEDGMAIAEYWGLTFDKGPWSQWGSMWYSYLQYHWDFPITFLNPPAVSGSTTKDVAFVVANRISISRASDITMYRPVSTSALPAQWVYLTAIGRWKN